MHKYEQTGVLSLSDLRLPTEKQLEKGVAVSECVQEIPCNPCIDSCPVHAISMKDINAIPIIDYDRCIGCSRCVGVCPGLALFVVKKQLDQAFVTLPYEFVPLPKKGDLVEALNRWGKRIDDARVTKVRKQGKTNMITISIEPDYAMDVRNIKVRE
jgi:Fe-S-cluster-containing hydrogenase component 2